MQAPTQPGWLGGLGPAILVQYSLRVGSEHSWCWTAPDAVRKLVAVTPQPPFRGAPRNPLRPDFARLNGKILF